MIELNDGKSPESAEICAPGPESMNWTKPAAASWFLLAAITESALPPFSEVACCPALHSGIGATRQSPLPAGTPVSRLTGIQAPITRLAMSPLDRPWYHWVLHEETGETRPPVISGPHMLAHFFVPASCRLIVTSLVPLTWYGWPPAAQIMLVVKPGSPASLVMYAFGFAACSFCASAAYSAHVLGTASLYLAKTFSL